MVSSLFQADPEDQDIDQDQLFGLHLLSGLSRRSNIVLRRALNIRVETMEHAEHVRPLLVTRTLNRDLYKSFRTTNSLTSPPYCYREGFYRLGTTYYAHISPLSSQYGRTTYHSRSAGSVSRLLQYVQHAVNSTTWN
jgi:hypothetical protein